MSLFINPNNRGPSGVSAHDSSIKSNKNSAAKETASKVNQAIRTPESRQAQNIMEVRQLADRIQNQWNELSPGELAEQIVDLEGRVALLTGNSPQVESIRRLAEHLHFQFVFPIVLELSKAPPEGMPVHFARTVHNVAKRIIQTQSLAPISELSSRQIDEVMRFAARGGA